MRQIHDLAGRLPAFRHRRWQSHRCPAAVAVTRSTEECRAARDDRRRELRRAHCRNRRASSYVCPALRVCLKPNHVQALERRADVAPAVVGEGLDTLWLYTTHPLSGPMASRLQVLQAQAQREKGPVYVVLAGVELGVQPRRLSQGRVLLSNDFFDVMVSPEAEREEDARVRVELRAQGLWAMGWEAAAEKACELLEVVAQASRAAIDVQVSRVDLAVDFQGWAPEVADRPFFHTRARRKGRYYGTMTPQWDSDRWVELEAARLHGLSAKLDGCKSVGEWREQLQLVHRPQEQDSTADYDSGRRFTGFAWGLGGTVSGRCYDKTHEISKSRKGWMRAVWRDSPDFTEGRNFAGREEVHVWRLELQFRREALREFQPESLSPLENLGSWVRLKKALPRLWRYATRRWLRHGRKRTYTAADGKKVTRFVESRAWEKLGDSWSGRAARAVPELHREAVATTLTAAMPQLCGYGAQVAASLVESGAVDGAQPFHGIMAQVLLKAFEHSQGQLEARFEEKFDALRARRRLVEQHRKPKPHRETRVAEPVSRWRSPEYDNQGRGRPRYIEGLGLVHAISMSAKQVGT